ncbi:MAG: transposase, partial [Candidatus Cloacimonetes bacterium]|nr:transposase [Candidatus Cloacimonadota bacterium]
LNIVALIAQQDGYNLLPASSILFSPKMELDSAKQVLQDQIIDQQIAFCNKGTYVFDRGYDDRKLIGFLIDNGVSFVIRGMGLRTVKEGLVEKNFKEVVDDMEFKYQLDGFKNGETFHCATRRVSVRTDDHPSKRSNSVEVSVVVVRKYKRGAKKGKDFYLFCDFDDPNMPEQEIITKAIDIYKKRWAIEEVHRQMKQSMRWESMRLGSYQGMKNLNAFMALALYFIYKCKDYVHILAIGFPKLLKYVKKDWTKPKEFIYYRITDVLNICINQIIQYKRRPSIEERRDQWQIKIRLN